MVSPQYDAHKVNLNQWCKTPDIGLICARLHDGLKVFIA